MLAQNLQDIQDKGLPGFKGGSNIGEFITQSGVLRFVFYGAGLLLLIYMIMGGFQLMFARGDPKAMQSAQGKITNALIGFVIVVFAYFLVQILGTALGLKYTPFGQIFGQ